MEWMEDQMRLLFYVLFVAAVLNVGTPCAHADGVEFTDSFVCTIDCGNTQLPTATDTIFYASVGEPCVCATWVGGFVPFAIAEDSPTDTYTWKIFEFGNTILGEDELVFNITDATNGTTGLGGVTTYTGPLFAAESGYLILTPVAPAPEPSSLMLLACGLIGLTLIAARKTHSWGRSPTIPASTARAMNDDACALATLKIASRCKRAAVPVDSSSFRSTTARSA
jgi:PEP-CTERM motif-containing protein